MSCSGGGNGPNEQFEDYLHAVHHVQIPEGRHYFVVVPLSGCSGCISTVLQSIVSRLPQTPSATVILSYSGKVLPRNGELLRRTGNVMIDSAGTFSRLAISPASTVLITTTDSRVSSIEEITPENYKDVLAKTSLFKL
jgi:hypothetical protein